MAGWQDLNRLAIEAIQRADLDRAEGLLAQMWLEAGTDELQCNTHFTEGTLRDAQERYADAEAAFLRALELDRAQGARPFAVADTLRSIGIVRRRSGNLEGAIAAFREASNIYRDGGRSELAATLVALGNAMMSAKRFEDARATYDEVIRLEGAQWHDRASAWIGAGEACRCLKHFPQALGFLAMATRATEQQPPAPRDADVVARAWYAVGFVARHGLVRCEVMAAFAFWYATLGSNDEFAAKAAAELATMPQRELTSGDPTTWRFIYRDDAGNVHVSSLTHGLYYAKTPLVAELGDIVDVELDNHAVVAIHRVS